MTDPSRLARFATALAADTGLSYTAAYKWATAEVGAYNNLGIMAGPGVPAQYATPELGAAAAAKLINSSPLYAGIRASTSGTTSDQLLAIAQSPWHLGPSGLRAAGGTDPYYARIFGLSSSGSPSGGTSSSIGGGTAPAGGPVVTAAAYQAAFGGITSTAARPTWTLAFIVGLVVLVAALA